MARSPAIEAADRVAEKYRRRAEELEEAITRLRLYYERVEAERNVYASVLQMIRGSSDFAFDDIAGAPGRAYRDAGGGYEGLQALAEWGLAAAERLLGERDVPVTVARSPTVVERPTAEDCEDYGRPVQPGQFYAVLGEDRVVHIGCRVR